MSFLRNEKKKAAGILSVGNLSPLVCKCPAVAFMKTTHLAGSRNMEKKQTWVWQRLFLNVSWSLVFLTLIILKTFFFTLKESSLFYYFTSAKFCFSCYLLVCLTTVVSCWGSRNHIFKRWKNELKWTARCLRSFILFLKLFSILIFILLCISFIFLFVCLFFSQYNPRSPSTSAQMFPGITNKSH